MGHQCNFVLSERCANFSKIIVTQKKISAKNSTKIVVACSSLQIPVTWQVINYQFYDFTNSISNKKLNICIFELLMCLRTTVPDDAWSGKLLLHACVYVCGLKTIMLSVWLMWRRRLMGNNPKRQQQGWAVLSVGGKWRPPAVSRVELQRSQRGAEGAANKTGHGPLGLISLMD